ncbi:hypothetical protein C8R43DRAFT_1131871 [Mycena crocata]|nr:hypothetical protein C8R43DRAFT_1131871 [Mycena crocata]
MAIINEADSFSRAAPPSDDGKTHVKYANHSMRDSTSPPITSRCLLMLVTAPSDSEMETVLTRGTASVKSDLPPRQHAISGSLGPANYRQARLGTVLIVSEQTPAGVTDEALKPEIMHWAAFYSSREVRMRIGRKKYNPEAWVVKVMSLYKQSIHDLDTSEF